MEIVLCTLLFLWRNINTVFFFGFMIFFIIEIVSLLFVIIFYEGYKIYNVYNKNLSRKIMWFNYLNINFICIPKKKANYTA